MSIKERNKALVYILTGLIIMILIFVIDHHTDSINEFTLGMLVGAGVVLLVRGIIMITGILIKK